MDYMMDKIKLHENSENIINNADKIVKMLKENNSLDDSEKLLTIELVVAWLNYDLYRISEYSK